MASKISPEPPCDWCNRGCFFHRMGKLGLYYLKSDLHYTKPAEIAKSGSEGSIRNGRDSRFSASR